MAPEALATAIGSATAMGCAVVGLMFLRYWRTTRDLLFVFFAASFWLMALNRIALVAVGEAHEATTLIYLVRFGAFLLIIFGVVLKNMGRTARPARED